MLSLQHTKTFLAVLDARGVRPAARLLGLSPSSVAEQVRRLEAELGAPLLLRGRGAAKPTAHGARFIPIARALLRTAERAGALVHGEPLRLAASTNIGTYMMHGVVSSFQRSETIRVEPWIGSNPDVAERLETGAADAALMEWWDGRSGFEASVWKREPLVLIVPPAHKWAKRVSIAAEELLSERLLGGEQASGTGRVLQRQLGALAARLDVVGGYGGTEAVKRAVRSGLGVSIVLASAVADEIAAGQLVALAMEDVTLHKEACLVVPEHLPASAPAARLRDHMLAL